MQSSEKRSEKGAVWENRHGYENQMAEDEWVINEGSTWKTTNPGWTDQPTINYSSQPTYATTARRQQPPQPQNHCSSPKKDGFSSLFVAETNFPSWED